MKLRRPHTPDPAVYLLIGALILACGVVWCWYDEAREQRQEQR